MGRSPFTNTILITNLPPFFIGYQQVRDWLYPCGTAKTCLFYPRAPKRKKKTADEEENASSAGADIEMIANEGDDAKDGNNKKTVLVNMLNPDQALKVTASFKNFSFQLDDRYKDIRCHMVPSSPDIPLPPPLVDETSKKVLGDKLWHNFVSLETSYSENEARANDGTTGAKISPTKGGGAEGSDSKTNDAKDNSATDDNDEDENKPKLLDADKVAAAAGGVGAYDADEDPLNAPQVLEAVKEFRRELDKTHGSQKTQRIELVAKKLSELRPRIRAQVDSEKKNRRQQQAGGPPPPMILPAPPQTSLPQPPLPGGPPPPPSLGLPPPPRTAADSGKRGRSNLPAWMTQQQQQQSQSSGDEPASKKVKGEYPSHFPSNLPVSYHPMLRQFLANQVKESMGEEEATLIDFLYTHILQGKTTAELLKELQVVLEEEADAFLKAVWTKVQEIHQQ